VQLADVPIDEALHRRARAPYLGVTQVVANRNVPWRIHDLRGAPEETPCEVVGALPQTPLQRDRFLRRDRHALAVDRIEAANGVAEHQIAFRKICEPFIAPAQVGSVAVGDQIGQRLRPGDDIVDFSGRQRCDIGEKSLLVVGRVVAEKATDADSPGVVLLCEDDAVAPGGGAARNDNAQFTAKLRRMAAIEPRLVTDPDINSLGRRPPVTQCFEPRRTR
jgi:hypothetical protein